MPNNPPKNQEDSNTNITIHVKGPTTNLTATMTVSNTDWQNMMEMAHTRYDRFNDTPNPYSEEDIIMLTIQKEIERGKIVPVSINGDMMRGKRSLNMVITSNNTPYIKNRKNNH